MTPEIERFLEAATRPLESRAADRDEARTELMARLGHLGVPIERLDLSGALRQVETAPRRRPWRRRAVLLGAFTLVLLGVGAGAYLQVVELMGMAQGSRLEFSSAYGYTDDFRLKELTGYVEREAPDLIVDLRDGEEMFTKALARNPRHLGLLQQHLLTVPPDAPHFLSDEQRAWIERDDADNALWLWIEARWALEAAEEAHAAEAGLKRRRARECLHRAAQLACFRDHSGALRREVVEAFPDETGIAGGVIRAAALHQVGDSVDRLFPGGHYRYRWRSHSRSLGSRAWLGPGGTPPGHSAELFDDWQKLIRLVIDSDDLAEFADEELLEGMAELAQDFRDLFSSPRPDDPEAAALEARSEAWQEAIGNLIRANSSALSRAQPRMAAPMRIQSHHYYDRIAQVGLEDMTPGRKTERAMFDRILSIVAALLWLLVAGMCAFEACRRRRPTRGLAQGLLSLLGRRDWAWIVGLGCLAPWGGVAILSFGTPLGMRDWSLAQEEQALAWAIRWGAAWTLSLTMLMQTVQWRWTKQGGFLGLGSRAGWMGWIVAVLAAAGFVAAGVVRYLEFADDEEHFEFLLGVSGCIAIPLMWSLWFGVQCLFTPGSGALRANALTRTMLPCCLGLVLLMLIAAGLFRWHEARWMKRDTLLPSWTSPTHLNALEQRNGERWADSLRAYLGAR